MSNYKHQRRCLIGEVFGRLRVINSNVKTCSNGCRYWDCLCECGKIKVIRTYSLISGNTQSCGCIKKGRKVLNPTIKHGKTGTVEHKAWVALRERCSNPKCKMYPNYGGRGITVCDRWLESFENFYEDMGERPTDKHSIDRIDVNGDYAPSNCRWATSIDQNRNKRKNVRNISGFNGVHKVNKINAWQAKWRTLDGKYKSRSFSVTKYGEELAFFAACEMRELAIERLNLLGAGYGVHHGE